MESIHALGTLPSKIIKADDLIVAAQKQEDYLKNQLGTISGTVTQIERKKGLQHKR